MWWAVAVVSGWQMGLGGGLWVAGSGAGQWVVGRGGGQRVVSGFGQQLAGGIWWPGAAVVGCTCGLCLVGCGWLLVAWVRRTHIVS